MVFSVLAGNQQLSNTIVVDNSVMMRWLFNDGSEADQKYAQKIRYRIEVENRQVIVPYIWVYEASFVTNYYAKEGMLSTEEAMRHLDALFDLCSVIRGEEMPNELFQFAHAHGLSTYDSSYIMLALQQGCEIATLDKEIIKASATLGLCIFR